MTADPASVPEDNQIHLKNIVTWLAEGNEDAIRSTLAGMHPAQIADLLESLPPQRRFNVWNLVPSELDGDVLAYANEGTRAALLDAMHPEEVVAAVEDMGVTDIAEVIEAVPQEVGDAILESLDEGIRDWLETTRTFEEGTAGRLMRADVVTVRADVRLVVVLRFLRRRNSLPPHTDALMVVDRDGMFLGVLPISAVLTNDEDRLVSDLMDIDVETATGESSERDVAKLFERRELISLAVVDSDRKLLGRLTIDEVINLLREETDRAFMRRAGLDTDEDLFAPILPSAQRRAVWLGINLLTAFLASWVIGQFEDALDKIVALAVLMPIVASMGGIAGSQTLTLTIRGMALGQIAPSNVRWLTAKETAIATLNGLGWAIVVALFAYIWFRDAGIGIIIAAAILLNTLAAALSGVFIPLILKKMGIDPALSGAVILTTVTDVVGFMSFLGLATLFLL